MTIVLLQIANLQQPAPQQRANLVVPKKWRLLVQFPGSPGSEREGKVQILLKVTNGSLEVHHYFKIVAQDPGLHHREVVSIENEVAVVIGAVVEV